MNNENGTGGNALNGNRMSLILADSELQLVPERFWSHPAVSVNAGKRNRRPSRVLLDTNLHHSLFKDRKIRNRKGRPDVVHQFLLVGLESLLSMDGGLELYVHTVNDEMITVSPQTRIPKNQNRFKGLFEELFRKGAVPPNEPLIEMIKGVTMDDVLDRVKALHPDHEAHVWTLHEKGELIEPQSEMEVLLGKSNDPLHLICIVGGFPSGDYRSRIPDHDRTISLHEKQLNGWVVGMELQSAFRRAVIRGSHTSGGA